MGPKTQNMVVFLRFVFNDGVLSSLAKHAKIVEEHAIHSALSFAAHKSAFNAYKAKIWKEETRKHSFDRMTGLRNARCPRQTGN